ncbi:MAG: hypothetical protein NZ700_05260 [Gemmataceae bacterium]|nr:hypothetical protein [Gemmataceae bacterium]MDW8263871.1 hypothetical protein [Gemmataceae bacterium]
MARGLIRGSGLRGLRLVLAPVLAGSLALAGWAQGRPTRAHLALNSAIDCERRGDYELAATLYQQAQDAQDDLTPAERQELANGLKRNASALKARQDGAAKLLKADEAVRNRRIQEAETLLKEITPLEQYLTPADKKRAQALRETIRPATPAVAGPAAPAGPSSPAVQARAKLRQARALLAKGNYDAAEALAREADSLNASFLPGEDTPRLLLADIHQARTASQPPNPAGKSTPVAETLAKTEPKAPVGPSPTAKSEPKTPVLPSLKADKNPSPPAKPDAKALLVEARKALEQGDFDRAERLAHEADKASSFFALHLFGDSPHKVLRDVQAARSKRAAELAKQQPKPTSPAEGPVLTQVNRPGSGGSSTSPAGSAKGDPSASASAPKTASSPTLVQASGSGGPAGQVVPAGGSASAKGNAPAASSEVKPPLSTAPTATAQAQDTEAARQLLKQGRQALLAKDYAKARELAQRAQKLKPQLEWREDTPEKLLADIQRASGGKETASADKTDPRFLLRKGRELFAAGKLDEARETAQRARLASQPSDWGLFEDSPDKLLNDIRKAQAKHDQEESARLLAEARRDLEKGNLDEAEKKALRAKRLHGEYSIWHFGDRPDKVLAEVEAIRARNRKTKLPPPPGSVVAKADRKPAPTSPPTDGSNPGLPTITQVVGTLPPARPAPGAPASSGPSPTSLPPPTPSASPTPVASSPSPTERPVMGPTDDARAAEARKLLAQARAHLRNGEHDKALELAEQVERMGAVLNRPSDDTPAAIRQLVQQARGMPALPPVAAVTPAASLPPTAPLPASASAPWPPTPSTPPPDPNKERAVRLLAEARARQRDGQLIEARALVLEAQKLNAFFGPDEDHPERKLLELASLCQRRIESLVEQATTIAAGSDSDPGRFQRAEASLLQARQLANGFGLDTATIDSKVAWLNELRTRSQAGAVAQAPPPTPAAANPESPQQRGQALLEKARLELRRGDTATARRLAEEVFSGPYQCQTEASALLRSIDVEEFNQRVLVANRTFDAGLQAFHRKDYRQAAAIFATIDRKLLRPDKQAKLKELMQTPEMTPTVLAQSEVPTLTPVTAPERSAETAPGVAQATDTPPRPTPRSLDAADNYARQVQAMHEIKFQQLREDGLRAMREASERFQAHDTEQALEILRQHLVELENSPLDRDKVAMLKRPVEARLQQFKTMKAQMDFEAIQQSQKETFQKIRSKQALAEAEKQRQVAELMKQYNQLFKEGKYREAELAAAKAHELDPDNVAADAGMKIARIQRNQARATAARRSREEMFVVGLDENEGPAVSMEEPMIFDAETTKRAAKREATLKGILTHMKSEKEREIERRLLKPINLDFKDIPLYQAIEDLQELTGLNIVPDNAALAEKGVSLEQRVKLNVQNIALKSALNILLGNCHLTYIIEDEVIKITTPDRARGRLVQRTWPVADLVIPIDNHVIPNGANLIKALGQRPDNFQINGPQPFMGPNALQTGTPVSMSSPGSSPGNGSTASTPPPGNLMASNRPVGQVQTMEDLLIKLITNTIAPHTWSDVGGPGTIDYFPLGMALVINQTPDVQEQVAELLEALRRLQDLEVSVEVRMISLQEAFFERIGMDFDLNIKTNQWTNRFEPQIVTQQFAPPGYINDFSPNRFLSGLTPAGNFTSDLDIPIQNSSFGLAIPPFGGFPNIPGANGGLSMGLAFLSDIQVFMFMEAAQGDRRTNIMQAPKLTLFNGQTSTIQIQDFQFFVTNVQVAQVSGQVVFIPNNQPIPLGINLAIQAVVSADRRFVRLNIAPTMTNLASATVPLFPVTTFITPVFEGGAQGQPIPFTQFIQQPTFTLVNIETSVSVPDGGTVLLGGLKLLNEGRNEFGPPILSKLPYINRLFKNVGYGRDTSSLLIMVTPRIIINYEEETRQTGVVSVPQAE